MFKSLRQRLIWSQVIPLLLILPLMGVLLIYSLEGQILIPQLARSLVSNARLLAEISGAEYELWGDPILFESLLTRVHIGDQINMMFLDGNGALLFSSNNEDSTLFSQGQILPGIAGAQAGQEVLLTNYTLLHLDRAMVDVYEPVFNASRQVIGIVRLTYQLNSIGDYFGQLRGQILLVLVFGLFICLVIGTWLAVSISRPVREVTDAINGLANGQSRMLLKVKGPQELRRQAEAVNSLVDQLHNLESSRRQLLANIVHELGRPLGALRSAIHALQGGAAADAELLSDLTHGMDEETKRLQYLLDELANLYDKTTGSLELNRQPVDTLSWLKDVLLPWRAAAAEKHLDWKERMPESLPPLTIDAQRMAQVIGNLVNNAIKYTPSGGSVWVESSADAKYWRLSVHDSGAGIHTDEIEKIFLPFYRGDTGRRIKQGMGLGLTISRELAAAHGGELKVESTPQRGSSFTVTLPL